MREQKNSTKESKKSTSMATMSPALVNEMNELLANEYLLFTQTLNFHWNLVGSRFYSVHVFLEKQYRDLLDMMDDLAERIRYLNGRPLGTLKEMKSQATLSEDPGYIPGISTMLSELTESHEAINEQIQKVLDEEKAFETDKVTEDFLIGLQAKHQKMIWMLRSHLIEGDHSMGERPAHQN